jgi:hypothetical protein
MEQQIEELISVQHKADLLRVLFHGRILKAFVEELITKNPDASESIKNGTWRVMREMVTLERKILNATDNQFPWLSNELNSSKLWDISAIDDLLIRIGTEEKPGFYEEFLGMLVSCLNAILYMQENRKNIHFGKYRALFKLFTDEVEADTNRVNGQLIFKDGKIFIKSSID